MATLNLLQRRRRDGSLTLRGRNPWDDPAFPEEYDFGFAQIGEGTYPAQINGKTISVEYSNARATYHITGPLRQPNGVHGEDNYAERPEQGFHAVLDADSVEFFDAPEVTEESIAAYLATVEPEPAVEPGTTVARPGKIVTDEGSDASTPGGKV